MGKPKSAKGGARLGYIDIKEISETLEKNDDLITNLVHNYTHSMVKIGDRKISNTHSELTRNRPEDPRGLQERQLEHLQLHLRPRCVRRFEQG